MRVAVILTARPSWAKLETVVGALLARGAEVRLVVCASALLERYGRVVEVVRQQYPEVPIEEVWSAYEGANLITSAKETGALLGELSSVLSRLRPDCVVVCADRHEVLAAAQAAAYLHLRVVHLQGGERSGSIDDRVRDSITHLSDIHCVATARAKWRVYGLTGSARIHQTGCPSIDLAKQALTDPPVTSEELGGAGAPIDLTQPFVIVLQHPVTDEAADAAPQMINTVCAVSMLPCQTLAFWPGEDAGADHMSKVLRQSRELHTVRNLPPRRFLRLLIQCACLIGNSSAGIREAGFLGVPVVNVGSRQHGRERGPNVRDVARGDAAIERVVATQIAHGPYPSSTLYGTGCAGKRIAEILAP